MYKKPYPFDLSISYNYDNETGQETTPKDLLLSCGNAVVASISLHELEHALSKINKITVKNLT